MNTVEQLTQALDDLIEKDYDLAERLIEKHLARLALKKRLKAKQEKQEKEVMSKKDGGSAYPTTRVAFNGNVVPDEGGMSLRDYFAAKAMQAAATGSMEGMSKEGLATWAYQMADAMLAVRAATPRQEASAAHRNVVD